jgi:ATP phosphoribosyltransferase
MTLHNGESEPRLKMAIQKGGRMTEQTIALLRSIDLNFDAYEQRLYSVVRNFDLDLLFTRDDDIPQYVASGTADLGVVGRNGIEEEEDGVKAMIREMLPLGFGHCKLVLAAPKEGGATRLEELAGKRIATKFPRTAAKFLQANGIEADLITLSGAIELAPVLDLAHAIIDISSSGSSLVAHDLVPLCEISRSEVVLVANADALNHPSKGPLIRRLLVRLRASLAARQYKYIVMNVPEQAVEAITRIVPGLKSPTVVPLAEAGWVALHTVVQVDTFWEVMEQLKEAGAGGILVVPIEKMLL